VVKLPRTEDGTFYTERIDLSNEERLAERVSNAKRFGGYGVKLGAATAPLLGPAGAVVGGALGAISGFILGDQETVFPIDMIAIPAYQGYLISGTPAFQIFIKEGEVLTQVQLTDAQETVAIIENDHSPKRKTRRPGAGLPKKYAKLGFKKGWIAYKKTPAYKKKQASKKKKKGRSKR
tara:strand:+ start:130 stop:663 length:534 start_codon:yes stop_codon:yes gene_type:complete